MKWIENVFWGRKIFGVGPPLIFWVSFFFWINACSSIRNNAGKKEDPFVYVDHVQGINEDDFELNAKRKILEKGLGELIEGGSQTIDGRLKEMITNSSTEGFVTEFSRIGSLRKKGNLSEGDAKGKVSRKAVQDALKERYKELGKPKFLIVIDETILGKSNSGSSISANVIVNKFVEFDFLDRNQWIRILEKENTKSIGVYGNQSLETKAVATAAEMEARILFIGQVEVTNVGNIENTDLKSYQAVFRFKILDVNTARIIAADNTNGTSLHVNSEIGSQEAIRKAVESAYPKIRDQISIKWKPGNLIRLKIEGLTYDDYVDRDVKGLIRSIQGVNAVSEVNNGNTKPSWIVLEIEALYNGNHLYQKMREKKADFGFDFSQKEVKPSSIHIIKN
ncbi:hypothetical protein [Leptospira weilii]|nr:hypothetical protein [Leptospira weilii]